MPDEQVAGNLAEPAFSQPTHEKMKTSLQRPFHLPFHPPTHSPTHPPRCITDQGAQNFARTRRPSSVAWSRRTCSASPRPARYPQTRAWGQRAPLRSLPSNEARTFKQKQCPDVPSPILWLNAVLWDCGGKGFGILEAPDVFPCALFAAHCEAYGAITSESLPSIANRTMQASSPEVLRTAESQTALAHIASCCEQRAKGQGKRMVLGCIVQRTVCFFLGLPIRASAFPCTEPACPAPAGQQDHRQRGAPWTQEVVQLPNVSRRMNGAGYVAGGR